MELNLSTMQFCKKYKTSQRTTHTHHTHLFELFLRQLQLHPPARLLLLHAALEALQDTLLWKQWERSLSFGKRGHGGMSQDASGGRVKKKKSSSSSHRLCQDLLVRLAVFLEDPLGFLGFF